MSNYIFPPGPKTEVLDAVYEQSRIAPEQQVASTSTRDLNDIPENVEDPTSAFMTDLHTYLKNCVPTFTLSPSHPDQAHGHGHGVRVGGGGADFVVNNLVASQPIVPPPSKSKSFVTKVAEKKLSDSISSQSSSYVTHFRFPDTDLIDSRGQNIKHGQRYSDSVKRLVCCKQYDVTGLDSEDSRGRFFAKVLIGKSLQLILILTWLLFTRFIPEFSRSIYKYDNVCFYVPLSLYFLLALFVRLVPRVRNCTKGCLFFLLMNLALWMAFVLGSLYVNFGSAIFPDFVIIMITVCLAMASVTASGLLDVEKKKLIFSAALASIMAGVALFSISIIHKNKKESLIVDEVYKLWLPLVGVTTILSMVLTVEIQAIIKGSRFTVTYVDWMYAAAYL